MSGPDRRPWIILSRTEALALQQAALASLEHGRCLGPVPPVLARALRMIDNQVRWIAGAADGQEPSAAAASEREAVQA